MISTVARRIEWKSALLGWFVYFVSDEITIWNWLQDNYSKLIYLPPFFDLNSTRKWDRIFGMTFLFWFAASPSKFYIKWMMVSAITIINNLWFVTCGIPALAIGTDVVVRRSIYSTIDIDPEEEPKIGHDISVIFFLFVCLLFIFDGARMCVEKRVPVKYTVF